VLRLRWLISPDKGTLVGCICGEAMTSLKTLVLVDYWLRNALTPYRTDYFDFGGALPRNVLACPHPLLRFHGALGFSQPCQTDSFGLTVGFKRIKAHD